MLYRGSADRAGCIPHSKIESGVRARKTQRRRIVASVVRERPHLGGLAPAARHPRPAEAAPRVEVVFAAVGSTAASAQLTMLTRQVDCLVSSLLRRRPKAWCLSTGVFKGDPAGGNVLVARPM